MAKVGIPVQRRAATVRLLHGYVYFILYTVTLYHINSVAVKQYSIIFFFFVVFVFIFSHNHNNNITYSRVQFYYCRVSIVTCVQTVILCTRCLSVYYYNCEPILYIYNIICSVRSACVCACVFLCVLCIIIVLTVNRNEIKKTISYFRHIFRVVFGVGVQNNTYYAL